MKSLLAPAIAIVFGFLGLLDTVFYLVFGLPVHLGAWVPGAAGALFLCWGLLGLHATRRTRGREARWLRRLCAGSIGALFAFFAVTWPCILSAAATAPPEQASWLIVLGAGLEGETPGPTLTSRLIAAVDYLSRHPGCRVVVSGGQGPGERISEAEAMARYLQIHGITKERVLQESRSTSTLENLMYSKALLESHLVGVPDGLVVLSSDSHLFRVRMLAKRVSLSAGLMPVPSPWYLWPNTLSRESVALVKSAILDWP